MVTFQWLEQLRAKNDGKSITLRLRHVRADGTSQPVDEFDLSGDVHSLTASIEERAQSEADVLGGTQTYAIVATNGSESLSRHLFRVDGSGANTDVGLSEPATAHGLTAQLMRHNEALLKYVVASHATTTAAKDKELARLTARCQMLEGRDDERALAAEKMRTKQHKRDLESKESLHRMEMVQEVVHSGRMLLPFVINEVVGKDSKGKKVVPDASLAPMEISAKAFFESLRPKQIEDLEKVLNNNQYMAVLMAWKKYVGGEEQK